MKRRVRFSKNEDIVILECVREHINNLTMAFKIAQLVLPKRTIGAITQRWYYKVSRQEEAFKMASVYLTVENRKVVREDSSKLSEFVTKRKRLPLKK